MDVAITDLHARAEHRRVRTNSLRKVNALPWQQNDSQWAFGIREDTLAMSVCNRREVRGQMTAGDPTKQTRLGGGGG